MTVDSPDLQRQQEGGWFPNKGDLVRVTNPRSPHFDSKGEVRSSRPKGNKRVRVRINGDSKDRIFSIEFLEPAT